MSVQFYLNPKRWSLRWDNEIYVEFGFNLYLRAIGPLFICYGEITDAAAFAKMQLNG